MEQEIDRELGFASRTLRDWQQERIPSEEKVEKLARYIVKHGRMTPEWLEKLLYSASHSDAKGLLSELFKPHVFLSYQRDCKADENMAWRIVRGFGSDYEIFWDQFVRITPNQRDRKEAKGCPLCALFVFYRLDL